MKRHTGWLVALALLVGACTPDSTLTIAGPVTTTSTVTTAGPVTTTSTVTTAGPVTTTATSGMVPVNTVTTAHTDGPTDATTAPDPAVGLFASALVEFDSCDAFIGHVKAQALERVGPYGLDGGRYPAVILEEADAEIMEESSAEAVTDGVASAPQAGVDYSTTNVQELGVDEPDVVKTDGNRILVLAYGILHYIDLSSGRPELVGKLDLWSWESQQGREESHGSFQSFRMFLSEGAALLIADGYGPEGALTQVVQVDLSDPADLTVTATLTVEGRYVSARMVGERVSLVLSSRPHERLQFVYPASESAVARAEVVNRLTIEDSTLEDWAPGYVLEGAGGVSQGLFIDCASSYAPEEFSGFDFLSVLSFDLADGIGTEAVSTVMSGGDTVYASSTNLYVATQRWTDWAVLEEEAAIQEAETISTHIHQFDIGGPDGAEYLASGSVDGFLLNQFAMSEYDGHLRVASTDDPAWNWWARDNRTSVSRVDVLARDGRQLRVVGSVGGLGQGERIFAVRFIGPIGYIVTFRQTDPLYTVDLSDPESPRVVGELKILGYSAYLHPIGDGLLLGIGQDADEEGRTRGAQVSVFDVSDLANPIRTHQFTVEDSYSDVEWDHRAFLYWAPKDMAVMPVGWWKRDAQSDYWDYAAGAFVLSVGSGGIRQLATLEHEVEVPGIPEDELRFWGPWAILRSLVVGDTLFTLSRGGLLGSDLDTFETTSWTGFTIPDYGR